MKSMPVTRDEDQYSEAERKEILVKMDRVANQFYGMAVQTGCHAFIEFCGLMTEFQKVCAAAERAGLPNWAQANTHNGTILPFEPHHAKYLAEKLNCIYGPALFATPELREIFVEELFGGSFKVVANKSALGDVLFEGMTMQQGIDRFLRDAQAMLDTYMETNFPRNPKRKLVTEVGKRFIRVVSTDVDDQGDTVSKSCYCFIDFTNGDILKSESWKKPAKHARGNVRTYRNIEDVVNTYGAHYMK